MTKEPVKLIYAIPDSTGNERVYLQLDDGRKWPLPFHFRAEEFTLPGNVYKHPGGKIIALFDDTTRTGVVCDLTSAPLFWGMWQPCVRADFFGRFVPAMIENIEAQAAQAAQISLSGSGVS